MRRGGSVVQAASLLTSSKSIGFDDRVRKRSRGFLRQVVPDAASQEPVHVLAGECLCVGSRIRIRRTVSIAFERDGGHGDDRTRRKLFFEIVVLRLAVGQSKPPPVVMDD